MTILGVIRRVLVLPPISTTVAALAAVPALRFGEECQSPSPGLQKVKLVKPPLHT